MINVGEFKYFITILKSDVELNDRGMEVTNEIIIDSKRAKVKEPSLRKQELYKQLGDSITQSIEFTFRKTSNIEYEYLVKWENSIWNIKGISIIDDKFYNILCEKVQ